MDLNDRHTIALQQISGYGSKNIRNLAELSRNICMNTQQELCKYVNFSITNGVVLRIKKMIDMGVLSEAIEKADWICTSPRPYIEKIVALYSILAKHIVSYHEAKTIKPTPPQKHKALGPMGETASNVISFGDRVIDIQESSFACFWGMKEKRELINSGYKHAIINPSKITTLIQ